MKTIQATVFASLLLGSVAAHAGTPSVSVTVRGEVIPGVYGEVQIGNEPPPPVVYAQPVIIAPPARHEHDEGRPLYLHVPPGHAKHWARHCQEYNACNRPVYFVKSAEYEPDRRAHKDKKHRDEGRRDEERRDEGGRGEGRGHGRGNEDRRGEGRD